MSTYNTPSTATPNFDNLLLHSLMGRLNLGPSRPITFSPTSNIDNLLSDSFEDFLSDPLYFSSDEDILDFTEQTSKSQLAIEESRLEKDIIKIILSGNIDTLKPNSGQAVSIGDHHVCVGFHLEGDGSGYRVWEWHGHVMLFDEEDGYTPEYIYGNYFEMLLKKKKKKDNVVKEKIEKEEEEKVENLGLRELIGSGSGLGEAKGEGCRVLHRGRNAGSPKVLDDSSKK